MWKLFNKKSPDRVIQGAEDAPKEVRAENTTPKKGTAEVLPKKAAHSAPKKTTAAKTKKGDMRAAFGVFVSPLATEKTAHMGENDTYAFVVAKSANKVEIKKAFARMYGVMPITVRVSNTVARRVVRGRTIGFRPGFKKAFVRVPKGSTINVYEGV